ncbi:LemA family protein [Ferruginibacter sp.]|uniref:LemA family protein n=1 Tax=Ferruginibacter sp. TaxID=1940288 RepID=UPI00199BEEE3|nr:LemA family protein [Ferruginibacter sp.]MBC7625655.1 LemA family protein [Ferruginibacter sp.]
MNNKRRSGYIIGGIIVLLGIFLITTYNGLVKKEELVKLQWNEVQNSYQRRIDFIPNVVNVVKGQANFEQTTLQQLAEARAKASAVTVSGSDLTAENFKQQSAAQDGLAAATNRLLITVEKYPELQGAAAFKGLQTQLEGTERRIKIARKDFNVAIADYNSSVRSFPTKIVAGIFGFKAREGFQSDAGADRSVEIKF